MSNIQQRAASVGEEPFATRVTPHFRLASRAMIALAVVGTLLACSEQKAPPVAPLARGPQSATFTRADKAITPAMIAWQKQARGLVGANNLNPLAAARVYAALSVVQYDAINEAGGKDSDGQ